MAHNLATPLELLQSAAETGQYISRDVGQKLLTMLKGLERRSSMQAEALRDALDRTGWSVSPGLSDPTPQSLEDWEDPAQRLEYSRLADELEESQKLNGELSNVAAAAQTELGQAWEVLRELLGPRPLFGPESTSNPEPRETLGEYIRRTLLEPCKAFEPDYEERVNGALESLLSVPSQYLHPQSQRDLAEGFERAMRGLRVNRAAWTELYKENPALSRQNNLLHDRIEELERRPLRAQPDDPRGMAHDPLDELDVLADGISDPVQRDQALGKVLSARQNRDAWIEAAKANVTAWAYERRQRLEDELPSFSSDRGSAGMADVFAGIALGKATEAYVEGTAIEVTGSGTFTPPGGPSIRQRVEAAMDVLAGRLSGVDDAPKLLAAHAALRNRLQQLFREHELLGRSWADRGASMAGLGEQLAAARQTIERLQGEVLADPPSTVPAYSDNAADLVAFAGRGDQLTVLAAVTLQPRELGEQLQNLLQGLEVKLIGGGRYKYWRGTFTDELGTTWECADEDLGAVVELIVKSPTQPDTPNVEQPDPGTPTVEQLAHRVTMLFSPGGLEPPAYFCLEDRGPAGASLVLRQGSGTAGPIKGSSVADVLEKWGARGADGNPADQLRFAAVVQLCALLHTPATSIVRISRDELGWAVTQLPTQDGSMIATYGARCAHAENTLEAAVRLAIGWDS